MADDRTWQGPERRTNLRLRKLIDDLQRGVRDNSAGVAALTIRVHDLEVGVRELQDSQKAAP